MRIVQGNYQSKSSFVAAVQRNALEITQDGATGHGAAVLGIWLDGNREGVSMRVLREQEMSLGQSIAWRPIKAFPLDRVAPDCVDWLAYQLGEGS